jgi:hypothetical protein
LSRLFDLINGDTKAAPSAIGRNILKLLDELNALAFSLSVRERSVAQAGPIARGNPLLSQPVFLKNGEVRNGLSK